MRPRGLPTVPRTSSTRGGTSLRSADRRWEGEESNALSLLALALELARAQAACLRLGRGRRVCVYVNAVSLEEGIAMAFGCFRSLNPFSNSTLFYRRLACGNTV